MLTDLLLGELLAVLLCDGADFIELLLK